MTHQPLHSLQLTLSLRIEDMKTSQSKGLYVTDTDWFAFLLLWDELGDGQRPRFRYGEGELLGLSCFGCSFLEQIPLRDLDCKLVHENIYLRAPPKGHTSKHFGCLNLKCSTHKTTATGLLVHISDVHKYV